MIYCIPYKHSFVLYVFVSIETVLWTSPPNIRSNYGTRYCNKMNTISISLLFLVSMNIIFSQLSFCLSQDVLPTMPFQIHIGINIDHQDQLRTLSNFKAYNKENIKSDVNMINFDALKSWNRERKFTSPRERGILRNLPATTSNKFQPGNRFKDNVLYIGIYIL